MPKVDWKKLADRGVVGLNEIIRERYKELKAEMNDLEEVYPSKVIYTNGHHIMDGIQGEKWLCHCDFKSPPCVDSNGFEVQYIQGQIVKARKQLIRECHVIAEQGEEGVIMAFSDDTKPIVSFFKSEAQSSVTYDEIERA